MMFGLGQKNASHGSNTISPFPLFASFSQCLFPLPLTSIPFVTKPSRLVFGIVGYKRTRTTVNRVPLTCSTRPRTQHNNNTIHFPPAPEARSPMTAQIHERAPILCFTHPRYTVRLRLMSQTDREGCFVCREHTSVGVCHIFVAVLFIFTVFAVHVII